MSDCFDLFRMSALTLGDHTHPFGPRQREVGLIAEDWALLTQEELWTPDQARRVPNVLANVVSATLAVAGIPAVALPGCYVAACIVCLVAPPSRLVAAMRAPETFDAQAASGLSGPVEIIATGYEQMQALVIAYSREIEALPIGSDLSPEVVALVQKQKDKEAAGRKPKA